MASGCQVALQFDAGTILRKRKAMSQNATPKLFDHAVLPHKLARAARLPRADFLTEIAVESMVDRLATVSRPFPLALVLGAENSRLVRGLAAPHRQVKVQETARLVQSAVADGNFGLPVEAVDLLASVYCLQSTDDLPGALIQMRRALKSDGLLLACMLGGRSLHELRDVLAQAESEISGGISPRVFPFADVRDMGGLLQRAGFALPVADSEQVTVRYDDMFALLRDLRAMAATNILQDRIRQPSRRALFVRAAALYAERHSDADGRIRATFETIWLSGWAPHESQQKPLRPGSAKARLADALKVPEVPLRS
jgi:SAM-dependent methyltransferase